MPSVSLQILHDTLKNLWNKDIYLQTETHQLKGKLVFVSKLTPPGTPYVSIQDILIGKQKVILETIGQVWLRNKCLWRSHS